MIKIDEFKTLLERTMSPVQAASFMDSIITKTPEGQYQLFGRYEIDKIGESYSVSKIGVFCDHRFSALRSAVAWCIMDRRNKILEAVQIMELDSRISSLSAEITQQAKLKAAATDLSGFLLHETKLDDALVKKGHALDRMDILVEQTKLWQENKFQQHQGPVLKTQNKQVR